MTDKEKLPYQMRYTIGDYSDDGHGKTDVLSIAASHPFEEIKKAYAKSVQSTGIDFIDVVACGYENRTYPLKKFMELGLDQETANFENFGDSQDQSSEIGAITSPEHYLLLITWFCKLSLPDLVIEEVESSTPDFQSIGIAGYEQHGYGLFH